MLASAIPLAANSRPLEALPPAAKQVLTLLQSQGRNGVSQMDALRALGMAGGSFTKRISVLRRAGYVISARRSKDPLTGRFYNRYTLRD